MIQVAAFFLPNKKNMAWNIFMQITLILGIAIQVALISAEYYARKGSHCPKKSVTLKVLKLFIYFN